MNPKDYSQMIAYLTRPSMPQGERIELSEGGGKAFRLKQLQADYAKFGKSKLDKGAKVLGFKNYAALEGPKNANFRRKIKNELTQFGEVLTEAGSRKRSRAQRTLKEADLQIKLFLRNIFCFILLSQSFYLSILILFLF